MRGARHVPAPRVVLPPRGRPWSGKSVAGTRRAWRAVTLSSVCWGLCLDKAWTMQKSGLQRRCLLHVPRRRLGLVQRHSQRRSRLLLQPWRQLWWGWRQQRLL